MFQKKYELTVDKIFYSSVRNNPDQVICYRDTRITYREFRNKVYALARGLVKSGLQKGEKVAVLEWDDLNYLMLYYAVPLAGGVLHTVNIRYSPELIFYTMQHAGDRIVVIRDEFVPLISSSVGLFQGVRTWIVSSDSKTPSSSIEGALTLSNLFENDDNVKLPELKEDDLCTIFYTSGTTGMPKGVTFTHRQILLHTLGMAVALADEPINLKSTDVIMPIVPMFHVHSWGVPYMAIMKGMKYVLPGRYDFDTLPSLMEKEKVNVSMMVPSILYMLMAKPENQAILKKLKLRVTIGGGALPKGLAEKARSLGIEVGAGYGMSETAPILTLGLYSAKVMEMSDSQKESFRIKTGIPIPLVDLRVVDKNGKDVAPDGRSIGEIVVRAPWLTSEYYNDPENTKKLWKNDWLNTGDLAVVDEYGYINIVDREKDAVKSGGEFIPTLVIEDVISTYPGVAEVAVVARRDEKWGERPVAFISGLKDLDKDALNKHLMNYVQSGRISKFWIPDDFFLVESFNKTSTGKIDKRSLRANLSS
ncbi:MAG: long-chain-fatty-acid--CoA ligase [Candidatus Thermoplasmatota archaeon]|nr:long-chain-fatty-acid--CoA ligase [Candidatus Thermoplasmatota archaeon]